MSSDLTERLAALSIKLDPSAVVHHGPVQGAAQWKEALQGKAGVPESCLSRCLWYGVRRQELTQPSFSARCHAFQMSSPRRSSSSPRSVLPFAISSSSIAQG
jgi:hypothetical protein